MSNPRIDSARETRVKLAGRSLEGRWLASLSPLTCMSNGRGHRTVIGPTFAPGVRIPGTCATAVGAAIPNCATPAASAKEVALTCVTARARAGTCADGITLLQMHTFYEKPSHGMRKSGAAH
jgi:hypothetical protein